MMKLMEKQKLKIDIRKQGINGEGIGYFNRVAVFVPGAIRKEVVHCEVEKVYDQYAVAKLIDIERPSKKRVMPPCKYMEECGRCELQHIEYNEQLKIKQLILEQSFKRYTSLNDVKSKVDLTINDRNVFNYSTYQELVIRNTNFGIALGYYKPHTNQFIYIEDCMVQHQEINHIAKFALKLFRKYKMKAYDLRNQEGTLHYLVIRYFKDTDQASVVIVVNKETSHLKRIADEMVQTFKSIQSVGVTMHHPESHSVIYHPVNLLAGVLTLNTKYHQHLLGISIDGTYPNHDETYQMVEQAIIKQTGLSIDDVVLDLFDGSTISSIYFSNYAEKVYAIDYAASSIKDGIDNCRRLGIENIEFIQDHVEAALPKLLKQITQPLTVVIHASKHGLSKTVIDLLNKYKVDQVVYLSQNPSSLAKDVDMLMGQYHISKVIPVDYYPQTARIDSITFLNKR